MDTEHRLCFICKKLSPLSKLVECEGVNSEQCIFRAHIPCIVATIISTANTPPRCAYCGSFEYVVAKLSKKAFAKHHLLNNWAVHCFLANPVQCIALNAHEKLRWMLQHHKIEKAFCDPNGNSLITIAAFYGNLGILTMLIETFDCNVYRANDTNNEFCSHAAAARGNTECLRYLLKMHPDLVYVVNTSGQLPLHTAVLHDQVETAILLASRMSAEKIDTADEQGNSALMLLKRGKLETLRAVNGAISAVPKPYNVLYEMLNRVL